MGGHHADTTGQAEGTHALRPVTGGVGAEVNLVLGWGGGGLPLLDFLARDREGHFQVLREFPAAGSPGEALLCLPADGAPGQEDCGAGAWGRVARAGQGQPRPRPCFLCHGDSVLRPVRRLLNQNAT